MGRRSYVERVGLAWDTEDEWTQGSAKQREPGIQESRAGGRMWPSRLSKVDRGWGRRGARATSTAEAVGTQGLSATPRNLDILRRQDPELQRHPPGAGLATS